MKHMINPVDTNHAYAIACSSSDKYIPYLGVYLKSIIDHTDDKTVYDIVILETDITEKNKNRILEINKKSNIYIRFINVSDLFDQYSLHVEYEYFAKQCYYRLSVGKLFSKYKRVLFTDIDIILNSDINKFFNIKMNGAPLAACKEVLWTPQNRKGKVQSGKNVEDYIEKEVKTKEYYNTGVLLVDIKKFNSMASFEKLIKIASTNSFINQEQDVLNQVFSGKIETLSQDFNFELIDCDWGKDCAKYMAQIEDAKLYHFLTRRKVWNFPTVPKGELWWSYARETLFYEELLLRLVDFKCNEKIKDNLLLRDELKKIHFPNINKHFSVNEHQMRLLFIQNNMGIFKRKRFYLAVKKFFSFDKKYEKYQQQYNTVNSLIKEARHFKKQLLRV